MYIEMRKDPLIEPGRWVTKAGLAVLFGIVCLAVLVSAPFAKSGLKVGRRLR